MYLNIHLNLGLGIPVFDGGREQGALERATRERQGSTKGAFNRLLRSLLGRKAPIMNPCAKRKGGNCRLLTSNDEDTQVEAGKTNSVEECVAEIGSPKGILRDTVRSAIMQNILL